MDSFGLPLDRYDIPWLQEWIEKHWGYVRINHKTLQAIDSQSCGLYALMYLVYRSLEGSMEGFQAIFSAYDMVKNDYRVARWFKRMVKRDLAWHTLTKDESGQSNRVPVRLMDMRLRWRTEDHTDEDDITGLNDTVY